VKLSIRWENVLLVARTRIQDERAIELWNKLDEDSRRQVLHHCDVLFPLAPRAPLVDEIAYVGIIRRALPQNVTEHVDVMMLRRWIEMAYFIASKMKHVQP
jgi:hypothetical protein